MSDLTEKSAEQSLDKPADKPELIRRSSSIREGPIVAGKEGFYRIIHAKDWGKILVPSNNPDGAELSSFELEGIQLNPGFNKIPAKLWAKYIELCFYMCPAGKRVSDKFHDSQLEVQVCLLRDLKTMSQWKIVVPKQVVSGVSVKAELAENIDIATGEKYKQFPPPGWVHAGSAHSHNTMSAFFSGVDDKSDSTVPGLHIVVGDIDHNKYEYSHIASVMIRKMRKDVDLEAVVEIEEMDEDFHPDVIDYIDTVVSANKKLLLKEEKETESENKSRTFFGFPHRAFPGQGASGLPLAPPSFIDENGNLSSFIRSLDGNNSDFFDGDSFFPFDDDIESIVNHSLDSGYSLNDVIQSIVRANFKRSKEGSSSFHDSDDDDDDDDDADEDSTASLIDMETLE